MYCPNCGARQQDALPYCFRCGLKHEHMLTPDILLTDYTVPERPRHRKALIPETALVALAAVFVTSLVWKGTLFVLRETHTRFLDASNLLTVVYGISSGLLSLVGLVAIFISFNSQHTIQRCRELLWEMSEIPYQMWSERGRFRYDFTVEQGIRQRMVQYQQVLNSGRLVTNLVIGFCSVTLTVVSCLWAAAIHGLRAKFFGNSPPEYRFVVYATLTGILMLICFGTLILFLSRVTYIANLPKLADLVDANSTKAGVPALLLAAMTMRLVPERTLHLAFAFPFENLQIFPWITGIPAGDESAEPVTLIGGPFLDGPPHPQPLHIVHRNSGKVRRNPLLYLVHRGFDPSSYERIHYRFKLQSRQGIVYVEFEQDRPFAPWVLYPKEITPKLSIEESLFQTRRLFGRPKEVTLPSSSFD